MAYSNPCFTKVYENAKEMVFSRVSFLYSIFCDAIN